MPLSTRKTSIPGGGDAAYRELYHEGYYVDDVDRYCPDLEVVLELSRQTAAASGNTR
jgi:hypothetical protein